jgi:hypothetical protein
MNLDTDNIFARSFLRSLADHVWAEVKITKAIVSGHNAASGSIWNLVLPVPKESSASSSSRNRTPSSCAPAARGGGPFGTDYVAIVGCPLVGRATHPGTTGRFGMWGADFVRIGGHDQDCLPAGYQDIDLMARANCCLKINMQQLPLVHRMRSDLDTTKTRATGQGCGTCLKNNQALVAGDLTQAERRELANYDRDGAKIVNCHPDAIEECQNWHMMNAMNKANMKKKLSEGKIVRNMSHNAPSWHLGEEELLQAYFQRDIGPCRPEQG